MAQFDTNDPESGKRLREMFGPTQVDEEIRRAIQFCWLSLPQGKRSVDEVERQIRRLVDRALNDMREDASAFGAGQD